MRRRKKSIYVHWPQRVCGAAGTVVGLMLCWVSEDGGMVVEECEKNLVLRVYDKIMFYI